jgi:hypothetical protein
MLVWLLLASLACAEITTPIKDMSGAPAEPEKTVKEHWSDLADAIETAHRDKKQVGVVVIYDLHTDAKLPPFIFITSRPLYQTVVIGFLNAIFGKEWRTSGKYWVLDKDEAVRKIAKAMKAKDDSEVKVIRSKIEEELGLGMFMVYRVDHDVDDEDEAPEPGVEPAALSSATAPVLPR